MAISLSLFFCVAILLAALWALLSIIDASRRPAYTLADWQSASDRISREVRRLSSARCLCLGRDSRFHRQTCSALLKDLHANTAFILNVVNDSCPGPFRRPFNRPDLVSCSRDVLSQSAGLMLRLHCARLQLFFWLPAARISRHYLLATTEKYIGLCLALADFFERCVH